MASLKIPLGTLKLVDGRQSIVNSLYYGPLTMDYGLTMCGIIGYVGQRPAQSILLNGLKSLEYRGYDSSGMALILSNKNFISVRKSPGKISALENILKKKPLSGSTGIAHTRWATHGAPNQENAHPHMDCRSEIAVVHNGIIENYASLKAQLIKEGHRFNSQTDTEVIVHLIEKFLKNAGLEDAVRKTISQLEGSFAIGVISNKEPDKVIGARLGSPLIVGVGKDENFLASDAPAILESTRDIIFLNEKEIAVLTKEKVKITDFSGKEITKTPTWINWDITSAQKAGYPHFMLKEINEQPKILENFLNARIKKDTNKITFEEQHIPEPTLKNIKNIAIVACGTAYHAGFVGKYIIESLCAIPVAVDVSSEFRYRDLLIDKETLVIAISQSGETADTLAGVREAKRRGAPVLAICNVLGSTLTRESDGIIYTHAGPEIGVASTKAYTAQLMAIYIFAFYLAGMRNIMPQEKINAYLEELKRIPGLQEEILNDQDAIAHLAHRHSHFGAFLYLGRNINFPSALEGALKLKEISYIPAEGYAAGEMKHGPIALIDEYRAVVCIACESKVYEKTVSNLQEIKARQGKIVAIATKGDDKIKEHTEEVIYVPKCSEIFSPLLVALPLQLIAYHIAVKRGCDVDQPRNLAKSVTVE
jgi:glucosamine--fructose-6-phosphate aminotransferase (isomerizing)